MRLFGKTMPTFQDSEIIGVCSRCQAVHDGAYRLVGVYYSSLKTFHGSVRLPLAEPSGNHRHRNRETD
jgi:hypothetical protein